MGRGCELKSVFCEGVAVEEPAVDGVAVRGGVMLCGCDWTVSKPAGIGMSAEPGDEAGGFGGWFGCSLDEWIVLVGAAIGAGVCVGVGVGVDATSNAGADAGDVDGSSSGGASAGDVDVSSSGDGGAAGGGGVESC